MLKINKIHISVIYWLTLGGAMSCMVLPWPQSYILFMPDWVLLVLIYWSLMFPEQFNIGKVWCAGILVDVLTGQLLGQHALAYVVAIFLVLKQHRIIRHFPFIQQSVAVAIILFIAQIFIFWIEHINHQVLFGDFIWMVFSGMLMWPVMVFILNKIRLL